jgi:hypothetical protein
MSEADKQAMLDGSLARYLWLGASHMLTGYDHLLFLFGVMFFLVTAKDILKFVTAFTLGHSITLIAATFAGITANYFLVDAVIALSVCYKGFDNNDGFKTHLGVRAPNILGMVFVFGLIHGFGLSTRLQDLPLGENTADVLGRIVSFNVGVELGQIAALLVMVALLGVWRKRPSFVRMGRVSNNGLIVAGFLLFLMQMHGYEHSQAEGGPAMATADPAAAPSSARAWKDTIKVTIPARGSKEYKFKIKKGATLQYRWKTGGPKLSFDFHGEPAGDKTGYFKSFKKATQSASEGSLTTEFEGTHGWYWKNQTTEPVVVTLQASGDYQRLDGAQEKMPVARAPAEDDKPVKTPQSDQAVPAAFAKLPFFAVGPVATVDGAKISAEDFNQEVMRMTRAIPAIPPAQIEIYKGQVLDSTIGNVLLEKAAEAANIPLTDADIGKAFEELKANVEAKDPKGMERVYQRSGLTALAFKEEFAKSQKLKAFVRQKGNLPAEVQGEELQKATFEVLKKLKASAKIETIPANIRNNPSAPRPSFGGHGHAH